MNICLHTTGRIPYVSNRSNCPSSSILWYEDNQIGEGVFIYASNLVGLIKIWQPCPHSTQFNKNKEPEKPRKYHCLWSQVDVLWSQFVRKLHFLHSGSFFCQQCMYVLAKHEAVFAPVSVYVFFNLVSFLDINFVNHKCVLLVTSLRIASCLCGSATSNLLITHTKIAMEFHVYVLGTVHCIVLIGW